MSTTQQAGVERMAAGAAKAVDEAVDIETRPGMPADHAFVFATLLRNYRATTFARHIRDEVYFTLHHAAIERILSRGGHLVIAYPRGAPETILGYLLYEKGPDMWSSGITVPENVIHYVYVKRNLRGFGVARALIESQGITPGAVAFTHRGPDCEALWRKYPTAEYWPYLL